MTSRTDPHSPGNVDPAAYTFVGVFYCGGSEEMQDAYSSDHRHLTDKLGDDWSANATYHPNGGCTSCGARYSHGAVVRYNPTGEILTVGHTCGEVFGLPSIAAKIRRKNERAAARLAEIRQARELLADQLRNTPGLGWALTLNDRILRDMADRGRPLSDAQIDFAFRLADKIVDTAYEIANDDDALPTVPVPKTDDRVDVVGEVISTKWVENDFGGSYKMLVEVTTDTGTYRLFGSVPSAIDPATGDKVTFTAKIERSRKDESFGFFKRPTKAAIV